MTDGIDALLPVLKLDLLLLLAEKARIDPWIFDEFAALDSAFEPGLEQRLVDSIAGSLARRSVWIQLSRGCTR